MTINNIIDFLWKLHSAIGLLPGDYVDAHQGRCHHGINIHLWSRERTNKEMFHLINRVIALFGEGAQVTQADHFEGKLFHVEVKNEKFEVDIYNSNLKGIKHGEWPEQTEPALIVNGQIQLH